MPNFSNIVIAGHLGADPELKYTPSGTAVCNFSVATKTGYGDRECTTWRRVTIFGKRGEKASELLTKGTAVIIAGEEQNREYTTNNGDKRYSLEVVAQDWSFAGSKSSSGGGTASPDSSPKSAPAAGSNDYPDGGDTIPF